MLVGLLALLNEAFQDNTCSQGLQVITGYLEGFLILLKQPVLSPPSLTVVRRRRQIPNEFLWHSFQYRCWASGWW